MFPQWPLLALQTSVNDLTEALGHGEPRWSNLCPQPASLAPTVVSKRKLLSGVGSRPTWAEERRLVCSLVSPARSRCAVEKTTTRPRQTVSVLATEAGNG